MTAEEIAAGLRKDEIRCILTIDEPDATKRAPVPDSIWHGRLSHLKAGWQSKTNSNLSEIGLAVRAYLENDHAGE